MASLREAHGFRESGTPARSEWHAATKRTRHAANNTRWTYTILLVVLIVLSSGSTYAQSQPKHAVADQNRVLSQGEQIASAVSTVTSTAISPLFGVCLIGSYQYIRTPQSERAALPFYSKPICWISIGVLLVLVLLKDTLGGALPLVKKPLDAVEVLVLNKASLVLLAFPVMIHQVSTLIGMQLAEFFPALDPVAYPVGFATLPTVAHTAAGGLSIVAGVIVTIVMWVSGHVLDVLCLLSPIPVVDWVLKGFRNALVLTLAVLTVLNPQANLAISLLLIALGLVVFSRALRFSLMGSHFAWDLLQLAAFGRRRTAISKAGVLGFSAGSVAGVPRHTLGRLMCGENRDLEFSYRVLGFGPRRRLRLAKANGYCIGRGLLCPNVILPYKDSIRVQFRLLPRYRGSEDDVCLALGAAEVQDLLLMKGWRRFLNWMEVETGPSSRPV